MWRCSPIPTGTENKGEIMKITVFEEYAVYEPKLWWVSPNGKVTGVAEWYNSAEEELEEVEEGVDEGYEAEQRNNNYEPDWMSDMREGFETFSTQADEFIERMKEQDCE